MLQVFREDHLQRDVCHAGAVLFRGHRRLAGPELADRPGHGRAAGGQENSAEDAPEAHAAAAPVRENRHVTVRGERVRVRGQERVAGVRPGGLDRVQRGPLAAGHTGRAGRHVQLSGAEDLHAVVHSAAASAAAQRQRYGAIRQTRQRHQRHDVSAEPHVGPRPTARLECLERGGTHNDADEHDKTHPATAAVVGHALRGQSAGVMIRWESGRTRNPVVTRVTAHISPILYYYVLLLYYYYYYCYYCILYSCTHAPTTNQQQT